MDSYEDLAHPAGVWNSPATEQDLWKRELAQSTTNSQALTVRRAAKNADDGEPLNFVDKQLEKIQEREAHNHMITL